MRNLALKILAGALALPSLWASPILVLNPSFETATLPFTRNGFYNNLNTNSTPHGGTVADWSLTGVLNTTTVGGAFAPSPGGFNWTTPWWQGSNVGYLQAFGGTIGLVQTLGATLQDNATYVLQVDVGRRSYDTFPFSYTIELLAGGVAIGSQSSPAIAVNSSGTAILTVNTGAVEPLAGQALGIELVANSGSEGFFDNVRLDGPNSPEPEPRTWPAGSLALAMAIAMRRAGRRKA